MHIVQLLPTISYGDAVSNDTIALKNFLYELGYETEIYAENIDTRLPRGTALHFNEFPELSEKDIIIYHASTGTRLNKLLPSLKGRKIMIYHNITPPEFFHLYSAETEMLTARGREEIAQLADEIECCIADSNFNKEDLLRMGYSCPIFVCPILMPLADYQKASKKRVLKKYKNDQFTNLLFVGRIAPNKKQENIIRAFYFYHKYYNKKSRLFLVGSWSGMEKYYERLCDYIKMLGISEYVIFTGHISFDEILAYYQLADVFVCMSEHEGFCVPLVEAMYFRIPIVAYSCAAIPDTLDKGGILLKDNSPVTVASAINDVVVNDKLKKEISINQGKRLEAFKYESVKKSLEKILNNFQQGKMMRMPRIIQLGVSLHRGDATSNDILAFQDVFVSAGYPSVIYVEHLPSGMGWDMIQRAQNIPALYPSDIVIYHHAIGTDLVERFCQMPCRKIMVYHNVTPHTFFERFDKNSAKVCKWGIKNVREMRGRIDGCITDSEFNRQDLKGKGYTCKIDVCPVLIPFQDYAQRPDEKVMCKYSDGHTNVVFVGRVAPNKKFEDIITAFATYQHTYDPDARLILCGSYNPSDKYFKFLQEIVKGQSAKNVLFTGHIPFSYILAFYRTADLFLCMSEHEGFCVPLLEAMYFKIPIIAYSNTAVTETLGNSGVLLNNKNALKVAEIMNEIIWNQKARNEILKKQNERLKYFSYDETKKKLINIIQFYVGGHDER